MTILVLSLLYYLYTLKTHSDDVIGFIVIFISIIIIPGILTNSILKSKVKKIHG
ncbi:hypothetical protein KCU_11183 [Pasteurella multocida subsp. multocida str. P52VAC]|nr:hypothetical protein KCU_11183 [Pasteurella multocida subsp. multocida str. P52VAC]